MKKKIVIFDYGLGNLKSLYNAFTKLHANVEISSDIKSLDSAYGIVFPGVGSFSAAREILDRKNLFLPLQRYLSSGRPVLGICLGMQLLFTSGDENGYHQGFDLIKGEVNKIGEATVDFKLPHVGWKAIQPFVGNKELFEKSIICQLDNQFQYFIHSYVAKPSSTQNILASVDYGCHKLVCAVQNEQVIGLQFHPEKSGRHGLKVLENFINLIEK